MLEQAKERYRICKACEHFNSQVAVCKVCGCLMRFKVVIPSASCPEGKWQDVPVIEVKEKETA